MMGARLSGFRALFKSRSFAELTFLSLAALGFAGCAVGPAYKQPSVVVPSSYKEEENWHPSQPSDGTLRGNWWEIYGDPRLNSLEEQVNPSNQQLKSAEAAFLQARALVQSTRSNFYPTVTTAPNVSRQQISNNKPPGGSSDGKVFNDLVLPFDAAWEPDLFHRIRYQVENAGDEAQASAADLENLRLSLHAELASDYLELRGLDLETQILTDTVASFQRSLDLTRNRYQGGLASQVDVAQAMTQLQTTLAAAQDLQVQRSAFEHAIAVLTGTPPSEFSLPKEPLDLSPPAIPVGLPSELLERRPDIASAERRAAAANADIGIARSAYYPSVALSGLVGFESGRLTTLLSGPSGLWAMGISSAQLLFDAGKTRHITEQQRHAFDVAVADYRQTVLNAFQEVEDNLAALHILDEESQTQAEAVRSARQFLQLSNNRYVGGVASYLEVTTAQNTALSNQRVAAQLLSRRMRASVQLIKALGGGWDRSALPTAASLSNSSMPTQP